MNHAKSDKIKKFEQRRYLAQKESLVRRVGFYALHSYIGRG
jgi:hypothetical protein